MAYVLGGGQSEISVMNNKISSFRIPVCSAYKVTYIRSSSTIFTLILNYLVVLIAILLAIVLWLMRVSFICRPLHIGLMGFVASWYFFLLSLQPLLYLHCLLLAPSYIFVANWTKICWRKMALVASLYDMIKHSICPLLLDVNLLSNKW